MQPLRCIQIIVHIFKFVLPGTHLHPSQFKHGRVKCRAQRYKHRNEVPTLEKDDQHQAGIKPARQVTAINCKPPL